jgi:conjugal transfer pilus assembly protein TraE
VNTGQHAADVRTLQSHLARAQFIQVGLLVAVLLLACAVLTKKVVTILEPPTREKTIAIVGDRVGPEWLEEMGAYMASMTLSATPQSIDWQHAQLLRWTTPQYHGELQDRLAISAKRLKESNATQVFWPQQVAPDPDHNRVLISGQLETYVNGTRVPGDHTVAFIWEYASLGGRALLRDWHEVPLDDPWLVKAAEAAQKAAEKSKKGSPP